MEEANLNMPTPIHDESKEEKTIDEILSKTTIFDPFHGCVQISTVYLCITLAYNFVLAYFTGSTPSWRCTENSSAFFCVKHSNESINSDHPAFYERCKLNRTDWNYTTHAQYSFVTEFDLVCEQTSLAAMVSASFFIGGILISVISGNVADRYGRKPVLVVSILATIISSIGCCFVTNVFQLSVAYAIRGASSVACYFTMFVYQMELVSPRYRLLSSNLLLLSAACSFLLIDMISYLTRYWRMVHVYAALPGLLPLVIFSILPESPRWLLVNEKQAEAKLVMEKINKFNGLKMVVNLKSPCISEKLKFSYLDLCRSGKVVRLTISVSMLWFTLAVVFYSIAMESSNLGGNLYQAFALSTLADFPSCFVCSYVCNRFGRKKSILTGLFVSGVLLGGMILVPKNLSYRYIVNLVIIILARFVNNTALNGLYTWTFELFPTVLRSQGMSVCVVLKQLGMFGVPFIVRVLNQISYKLPFLIMFGLAVVTTGIGLVLPETNKLPTRESYDDFFEKKEPAMVVGRSQSDTSIGIRNPVVQPDMVDTQP